jgi:serine O-acetyltransferase
MADEYDANPPGIGFWSLVREDFDAHGRDWTSPGFRAVFVHRFGNWRMGIRSKAVRAPFSLTYRWLYRRIRRTYGIEVEYCTKLGRRVVIDHQSGIVINGYSEIGDDCRLRQNVTIGIKTLDDPDGAPKLGRRVDIGAGAVVLGRIEVGDDAQIGANAVVLRDVPAGALAVGVPARIIERVAAGAR